MRAFIPALLLLISTWPLLGCNKAYVEPKPATNKVQGKVVYKDGKAYANSGIIEFRHETQEGVNSRGAINKTDGTFVLFMTTAQHKVEGALEGSYRVTIHPTSEDQNVLPIELAKKYAVVAGDNQVTIVIDE